MKIMRNFEKISRTEAETHVRKYKRENPTQSGDNFYEIHAVSTTFAEASIHFNLDLSELEALIPSNAIGVRIYIGDTSSKKVNYLVFTGNPKNGGNVPDDILGDVFLIKSRFMNLKNLRKPKGQGLNKGVDEMFEILTFHQSCDPDCPEVSLFQ